MRRRGITSQLLPTGWHPITARPLRKTMCVQNVMSASAREGQALVSGHDKTQGWHCHCPCSTARETRRKLQQIESDSVWFLRRAAASTTRAQLAMLLISSNSSGVIAASETLASASGSIRRARTFRRRGAKWNSSAHVRIAHRKPDFAGLLEHFGEVEIKRRFGLARQHDKAHRPRPDLFDHFAQVL